MTKNALLLLVIWNIALTALVGWSLTDRAAAASDEAESMEEVPTPQLRPVVVRDTAALAEARIAYFFMDTVQANYTLVQEQGEKFRKEGRRLESNLQGEMAKAQRRYEELMGKDHTYSTKAEIQADEEELQGLMGRLQQMQSTSEQQLARLEVEMLNQISDEIMDFLSTYNAERGFDYIFSVQNSGQIWVGNPDLDITQEVIDGLNARHKAAKGGAAK